MHAAVLAALLLCMAHATLTEGDMPHPPYTYVPPNYDATFGMDGLPQSSPVLSMLIYASKCAIRYGCSVPSFIQTDKGSCKVTTDKSSLRTADGVFFHWQRTESFPSDVHRRPGAFWVFTTNESGGYSFNLHGGLLEQMNNDINVLMSYERSSDIYIPFDYLVPRPFPLDTVDVGTKHKKKLIVAIISNCNAHHRKMRLDVCHRRICFLLVLNDFCSSDYSYNNRTLSVLVQLLGRF
jgi:hypothetical protein